MNIKSILLLFCLLASTSMFSQFTVKHDLIIKDGNYFFLFEKYEKALNSYLIAYEKDPGNANINYKIGLCYLNMPEIKDNLRAIPYLERASKNTSLNYKESSGKETSAPVDAWYFLGNAYRIDMKFDKARECYSTYLASVPKKDTEIYKYVDREHKACENAKELVSYPKVIKTKDIGKLLGATEEIQSCPVVSKDGNILVFCYGNNNIFPPGFNLNTANDSYEIDHVYWSKRTGNEWSKPENLMNELGTKGLTIPVSISSDGKTLYLVRDDNDNGNIYASSLNGSNWQKMKKLNRNISTKYWETHASISSCGKKLYFTSERPDGYGGLDIYMSQPDSKGNWGKPVNLGKTINTPFDEETPFIIGDTVLFFSSQGHYGMGGFDVFCSTMSGAGWSEPLNIGYPFNTVGNDLVYLARLDEELLYAPINTTALRDPSGGESDFYSGEIPLPGSVARLTLTGKLLEDSNIVPKDFAFGLTVTDSLSPDNIKPLNVMISGNLYSIRLNSGHHNIIFDLKDFGRFTKSIYFPPIFGHNQLQHDLNIEPGETLLAALRRQVQADTATALVDAVTDLTDVTSVVDSKYYIGNFLFGFNQSSCSEYSALLDSIAHYLNLYPGTSIKLTGFADTQGDEQYNLELSKKRALYIKSQLIERNVKQDCIVAEGKGESQPVAVNLNPGSRKFNRRVEIDVISDKVKKLIVIPAEPPSEYKIR